MRKQSMTGRGVFITGALLCALAVGSAPTVVAADATEEVSDETRADVEAWARNKEISIDEAFRRFDLRTRSEKAFDLVTADIEHFGAIYQDEMDGGWVLRIQYVGDLDDAMARLRPVLDDDVPVAWTAVARSYQELTAIKLGVIDLWTSIDRTRISSVSIDVERNQVVVATPAADEELQGRLSDFGSAIAWDIQPADEYASCLATNDPEGGSRYACTNWRGGIELQLDPGIHTFRCTATLWGKRKSNASAKVIVTAGHCGELTSQDFFHDASFIGTSTWNSNDMPSPKSDSRRIPAVGNTSKMNKIYYDTGDKSYAITGIRTWSQQALNDPVCKSGVGGSTFGLRCGWITDPDTTILDAEGHILQAKKADFNGDCLFFCDGPGVSGGDSGAPVFQDGILYGLAVTPDGKYSVARDVEYDMAVWFCLNADCTAP